MSNKEKLINEVHTQLTQSIITGADPQKAIDSILKKMNTSKNNAGRLVMTEEAYLSSLAQKECFNDLDVEKYEVVATLDSHTSDICQSLDGKVFDMKDYEPGTTAPPFHVNCRSTMEPYFDENSGDIVEYAARDSETGKTYYMPDDIKYQDWKETFVDGGDKNGLQWVDKSQESDIIKTEIVNAVGHRVKVVNQSDVKLKGEPNSITQTVNAKGGINRNYYDENGMQSKQISNNHHNHKALKNYGKQGEHVHDYIYDEHGNLIDRPYRELNDKERKENEDIL